MVECGSDAFRLVHAAIYIPHKNTSLPVVLFCPFLLYFRIYLTLHVVVLLIVFLLSVSELNKCKKKKCTCC